MAQRIAGQHPAARFLIAGDGELRGHRYSEYAAVIQACGTAFEAVWERATPHEDYRA